MNGRLDEARQQRLGRVTEMQQGDRRLSDFGLRTAGGAERAPQPGQQRLEPAAHAPLLPSVRVMRVRRRRYASARMSTSDSVCQGQDAARLDPIGITRL